VTTIAVYSGEIAADSQCVCGSTVSGYVDKLVKTSAGVVGVSGDAAFLKVFVDFLETGVQPDDISEFGRSNALVLLPDGSVDLYCLFRHVQRTPPTFPIAIGSGAEIAIGAMVSGKTAEEAVAIACMRDCYSGGPISVFYAENGSLVSRNMKEMKKEWERRLNDVKNHVENDRRRRAWED
jgi:hypothetical protein